MSNINIQDTILEAIDIIASQRMNFAKYDKTIQGVILQCVDATIGKYKVRYQDSIFIAYSENTSTSYSKGASVYILVPNSDMTKSKTIIGAVNRLGTNFVQVYNLEEKYNLIGSNIVNTANNSWGLCSFKQEHLITLYNYQSNNNLVNINTTNAQEYLKKSNLIILSMDVRTELEQSQRSLGNYGLVVQADFKNQTVQNEQVTKYFVLNIDNFVGNPYLYTVDTQQKAVFEIDSENFVRIRTISLFSRNFPNYTSQTKPNDIFISNLSIQGGVAFSTDELNTSTLVLTTPRGYIFDQSDAATAYRTIQASVRIKGKTADINSQGIDFYWFVEDSSVTTLSPMYMKDAGQGWRCLNEYNEIDSRLRSFVPGSNILKILKQDVFTERVRYKCVAIYRDNTTIVLSQEIEVINYDAQYRIVIQSDLGTQFYKDNGTPTLTCRCFHRNEEITMANIEYVWSMTSSVGVFQSLSIQDSEANTFYSVSKTLQINVARIVNFAIFKCSVFLPLNQGSTFIGTGAITISNSSIDNNSYYLIINNGTQLFKYSTTGLSPASAQLDDPIELKALSFNLYNSDGTEVDVKLMETADVTWTVPVNKSMLTIVTNYEQVSEEEPMSIIKGTQQIVYKIKDNYSSYLTNNQIELTVRYNGKVLEAKTDFTFIKQGESGTNGTDYVFRFVPDIQDGTTMPQYPTITFYSSNDYAYNWTRRTSGRIGKSELWHNGDLIYSSSSTSGNSTEQKSFSVVSFQTLKNNYSGDTYKDRTMFQAGMSSYCYLNINASGLLNTSSFLTTPFAAILKATATYEGIDFISTMPLSVGYLPSGNANSKIFLKQGTGFNRVLYTSSGVKPMYDNRSPFEIQIIENDRVLTDAELSNFTFSWNCVGSVWSRIGGSWREVSQGYLTIKETQGLKRNQVVIRPANQITGQCVTTAVVCRVNKSGSLFGFLYIPVHMSLNRYENSAINGWDGNSVDLGGSNGGMILAPQVGAGAKDNANRFTGIIMGTAKDPREQSSDGLGYDIGLFGYHQGQRSIFLDAKTGKAYFGVSGSGQIIIDPSTNEAILKSGNYRVQSLNQEGAGMQINLTQPSIRYGNRRFMVDQYGNLTATGADIDGTLRIDGGGQIIAPSGGWNASGLWLGGSSYNSGVFKVDASTGSVVMAGDISLGSENNPYLHLSSSGLTIRNGEIRIGPDLTDPYVLINKNVGLIMKHGSITIGATPTVTQNANGTMTVTYNDPKVLLSPNSGLTMKSGSIQLGAYTSAADQTTKYRFSVNDNGVVTMQRGSIQLGYNSTYYNYNFYATDTGFLFLGPYSGGYNFVATPDGQLAITKKLSVGRLASGKYSFVVENGLMTLYTQSNTNNSYSVAPHGSYIDANGVVHNQQQEVIYFIGETNEQHVSLSISSGEIAFKDITYNKTGYIKYKYQQIRLPSVSSETTGDEIPDNQIGPIIHYNSVYASALTLKAQYIFFEGEVILNKTLSVKNITNEQTITTKKLQANAITGETYVAGSATLWNFLKADKNRMYIGKDFNNYKLYINGTIYAYHSGLLQASGYPVVADGNAGKIRVRTVSSEDFISDCVDYTYNNRTVSLASLDYVDNTITQVFSGFHTTGANSTYGYTDVLKVGERWYVYRWNMTVRNGLITEIVQDSANNGWI